MIWLYIYFQCLPAFYWCSIGICFVIAWLDSWHKPCFRQSLVKYTNMFLRIHGRTGLSRKLFSEDFFPSSGLYFLANRRKNWRETVVLRIRNWEFSGSDSHKKKFPFVFYTFRNPYLKAKIVILRWSARDQQNSTVGIFVLGKKPLSRTSCS